MNATATPFRTVKVIERPQSEHLNGSSSATSANSAHLPSQPRAVWPKDSILENFMQFAREYSESEDQILIGCILPVVARLLARRVSMEFAGPLFPNVFSIVVTPPGGQKSTTIGLAEKLARRLLDSSAFHNGAASEQALFKAYQANPDRLEIEGEGNTVLANWATDAQGKIVAKRHLSLYDCDGWVQSYMRQAEKNTLGEPEERIEQTSTSLLMGTTFNNCRLNGVDSRDGLRRRMNYYVSERGARINIWPKSLRGTGYAELAELYGPLLHVGGEFVPFDVLGGQTYELFAEIQRANRRERDTVEGFDSASEARGAALSSQPAKILKLAMIFELCRWAVDDSRDWKRIQPDTLQLAKEHSDYCLHASKELDQIGRRHEIRDEADNLLAKIRTNATKISGKVARDGWIELSKSQLTAHFAGNPGRGSTNTTRLYCEIIADLERRELAKQKPSRGKLVVYRFKPDDPEDEE